MLLPMILLLSLMVMSSLAASSDLRRPMYSIGHMVNSIEEVTQFLDMGANVLELDVTFFNNGTLNRIYHGAPCDCDRVCDRSAPLPAYLDHVRKLTNPEAKKSYHDKLIMLFFDLKLQNVKDKAMAGIEMANAVLDHLWVNDTSRNNVRILMFVSKTGDNATLSGFINRFERRGATNLLKKYAGFDGGMDNLNDIKNMLRNVGITDNVWIGDGTINCYSATYPVTRLVEELKVRDSKYSFVDKVYHWTIDDKNRIRKSLSLSVDGFITNRPDVLNRIMLEKKFASKVRLATIYDDPFAKYIVPNCRESEGEQCNAV